MHSQRTCQELSSLISDPEEGTTEARGPDESLTVTVTLRSILSTAWLAYVKMQYIRKK